MRKILLRVAVLLALPLSLAACGGGAYSDGDGDDTVAWSDECNCELSITVVGGVRGYHYGGRRVNVTHRPRHGFTGGGGGYHRVAPSYSAPRSYSPPMRSYNPPMMHHRR